jgi:dihydrolipoamide dehydrogenase
VGNQQQFDVVVIGAGVGGYVSAIRAAQLGARVGIVEKQYLGGTCLNVGCIPSKALLHVAQVYSELHEISKIGINLPQPPQLDMSVALAFKEKVVKQLTNGVGQLLKSNGVTTFLGAAEVKSPTAITVRMNDGSTQELRTSKLILANGSVPIRPPFGGLDGRNVLFSDDALNLDKAPESLICIGGGVIAVELACMFNAFGTKVTIVEMLPALIANEDEDVRQALQKSLSKRGIEIHLNARVEGISDAGGAKRVTATTPEGQKTFDAEYVLVATGRKSNTAGLDVLVNSGLAMDRGKVIANERMETNLPGVYAIGDLVGRTWLAHVAETEGEIAAENATGHEARMDYNVVPRPIFTFPEIASVGLTEAQAVERGHEVEVDRLNLQGIGKANIVGEGGMVKVVAEKAGGPVLGVHMVGPHVTDLISEGMLIVNWEAVPAEVAALIHPHPTLSEGVGEAFLALAGKPLHGT